MMRSAKKTYEIDMLHGAILPKLLRFAVPLTLSTMLQLLFNAADVVVVGRWAGDNSLAAVGSNTSLIALLTNMFLGLSIGANILAARHFGAHEDEELSKTVHTSILLSLYSGVFLTVVGILGARTILIWMQCPANVLDLATLYLRIYFAGMTATMLYNFGAALLRASGDTQRPLYYLFASGVVNVILNLVFVIYFHMDVAGVALATVISQCISAALVIRCLMKETGPLRLDLKKLKIHGMKLKQIMQVGIPAALQMAVTAFSNVFVQSYINRFGPDCMSGWTAYTKIDQLMFLPMQSLALSATTFVGQNLGAGNAQRAHQGTRRALAISLAVTAVLMVPVLVFAPQLTAFFNRKAEVVAYGTLLLRYISPFYLLCCINQIYSGALRGAGNSQVPMVIMLGSFVVFRQIYLYIMSHYISNALLPLAMGYPAGWLVCSAATLLYYRRAALGRRRLVEDN